jgi:hypothetical protein
VTCGDGYRNEAAGEQCDPGDPGAGVPEIPCADSDLRCAGCQCVL